MAEVQTTFQDAEVAGKAIKIISFAGQLDETNVDEEAKKVYQIIDEMAVPNLLLDFTDLAYMNSKSIGYVTDWYSRAATKNGMIVISSPRPNILDILKVVGITQIINIYDQMEEAKAAFSVAPEAPASAQPATSTAEAAPAATPPATPAPETPAQAPATPPVRTAVSPGGQAEVAPTPETPAEEVKEPAPVDAAPTPETQAPPLAPPATEGGTEPAPPPPSASPPGQPPTGAGPAAA